MSDYTKLTNYAVKDSYPSGTPAKVIKGTELDDEFNAIATAVATKVNSASPTITGTATIDTASITNNASVGGTLNVTGASTLNGNTTLNGSLIFEGATANDFETTVSVTDPTADRTITFPDKTGTVALTSDIPNSSSLTSQNGTYSIAGTTTLTVTATAHGRAVSDVVYLNFTSGTAVDGSYTITAVTTNTFTVTHGTSITSSGNVSVHYSNKGLMEFISADEAAVGTSTSKAMTAAATAALIAVGYDRSLTQRGYQKLPGGLILQWGRDNTGASVTFPIAFPNECFSVVGSPSTNVEEYTSSITTTGFYFGSNTGGMFVSCWIAIGY